MTPRIALIGAGTMGSLHARIVAQSTEADLAVLVDPREDVGRATAERFGTAWAPELDDASAFDGVIVAAATEAHEQLATHVLDAGTPLFVEKPVTSDIHSTRALLARSERDGVPIMCGFVERFNPAVRTAFSVVEAPVHVSSVRHGPYAPRIRTGVAWDLLVHDADLAIQTLGGSPTAVHGFRGQFDPRSVEGAEDVAEATLRFAGDRVAHVSASRVGQRKVRTMTINELDRLVEVDLLRRDVTIYRHVDAYVEPVDGIGYRQRTVIEIPELVSTVEPLAAQFAHFVGLVTGTVDADRERASIHPAHEAIAAVMAA